MGAVLERHGAVQGPALRLGLPDLQRLRPRRRSASAAIMEIPVIHIFTHDSIGVGEDGPTHQPIEQLASLRAIPGLIVIRPADANEVVEAWRVIMQLQPRAGRAGPHPPGPADARPHEVRAGLRPGQGRLRPGRRRRRQARRHPDRHRQRGLALPRRLREAHGRGRSRPAWSACRRWELFERPAAGVPRRACCRRASRPASRSSRPRPSAGSATPGDAAPMIGMHTFGASAPLKELLTKFGFTPETGHRGGPVGSRRPAPNT